MAESVKVKGKKEIKGLRGVLILFFAGLCLLGIFFRLNNKKTPGSEEETVQKISAAQQLIQRNLTNNYPNSPKEVVKYFSEITKCYYNEEFESEEELQDLADKMLGIMDDELVSYKNHEDFMFDLRSDINFYNTNGFKISSYAPSASTDVFYFKEDGYEWARLWCAYTIKAGQERKTINEVFVLRKDENSHWKVYGWKEDNG